METGRTSAEIRNAVNSGKLQENRWSASVCSDFLVADEEAFCMSEIEEKGKQKVNGDLTKVRRNFAGQSV